MAGDGFASRKTTPSPIAFKGQGRLYPGSSSASQPGKKNERERKEGGRRIRKADGWGKKYAKILMVNLLNVCYTIRVEKKKGFLPMAYISKELSTASLIQDIKDLLNAPDCFRNPPQRALIAVLTVSLVADVNGYPKPLNLDQSKQFYSVLFTLAGDSELGDELRSKVYELAAMLYAACLNL